MWSPGWSLSTPRHSLSESPIPWDKAPISMTKARLGPAHSVSKCSVLTFYPVPPAVSYQLLQHLGLSHPHRKATSSSPKNSSQRSAGLSRRGVYRNLAGEYLGLELLLKQHLVISSYFRTISTLIYRSMWYPSPLKYLDILYCKFY